MGHLRGQKDARRARGPETKLDDAQKQAAQWEIQAHDKVMNFHRELSQALGVEPLTKTADELFGLVRENAQRLEASACRASVLSRSVVTHMDTNEPRQVFTSPFFLKAPTQWLQRLVDRISFADDMPIRVCFKPVCEVEDKLRITWIYEGVAHRFTSSIDVSLFYSDSPT